ncbi:Crp/Fnr family transcriptional regulator [Albidovulum sp.]|uniref:Crp/Fnr family transcriptional regulator n=1 Tax=Albidovulum sp. TaxID=1872424 RepID=UPI0039B8FC07
MIHADIQTAKRSPVLSTLSEPVRACLLSKARVRSFPRGSTLFIQGETARSLKIVVSGLVKLYRIAPSGCEAIVDLCAAGRSFEELAALRGECHRVCAQAATDVRLLLIDVTGLDTCRAARGELTSAIVSATAQSLDSLLAEVERLKVQSGAQRLTHFLMTLCDADEGPCEVDLPYEKHLIAGHLGMKPESLSRAIGRLRGLGVSVRVNRVVIDDVAALRSYVETDPAQSWAAA